VSDVLQQLDALTTEVEQTARRRAAVEGQRAAALKQLGVEPDGIDEAIATLEASLTQAVAATREDLAKEDAALREIERVLGS
jgi:Holliday junction resolvasome RuvABC DNA-binding subunit